MSSNLLLLFRSMCFFYLTINKNHKNSKRNALRLPNNLRQRCYVFVVEREGVVDQIEYSVPIRCCQRNVHEHCLVRWFQRTLSNPWCHAKSTSVNPGYPIPRLLEYPGLFIFKSTASIRLLLFLLITKRHRVSYL